MQLFRFNFKQYLGLVVLYALLSSCFRPTEGDPSATTTTGGTSLTPVFRQQYATCSSRNSPSGPRFCKIAALNAALSQLGLRAPSLANVSLKDSVNDLNRRRFAVTQACIERDGLKTEFQTECEALTGTSFGTSLFDVLNMIGGFGDSTGKALSGIKTYFEYQFIKAVAELVYDKSGKQWLSQDNFVVVSDRKVATNGCLKLTEAQKSALEKKYASGDRFPMQLMSLSYVAQHTYESMRAPVNAKYRWIDCVLRSVSAALCATPKAVEELYDWMRMRIERDDRIGFTPWEVNELINMALLTEDGSWIAHYWDHWPIIGHNNNTMDWGVVTNLLENGGVGTYVGSASRSESLGHAVVVSVHPDGADSYRIYTHDFQGYFQYEGLPRLSPIRGSDPRNVDYKFIKVSSTPMALDPNARGLTAGALQALQEAWFRTNRAKSN